MAPIVMIKVLNYIAANCSRIVSIDVLDLGAKDILMVGSPYLNASFNEKNRLTVGVTNYRFYH